MTRGRSRPCRSDWEVRGEECVAGLRQLGDATVDAVITDPPYGINFAGQKWDRPHVHARRRSHEPAGQRYQHWSESWARECLRVLKPGGHMASFGSPRTAHRLASAIEDTGFELRDTLLWLHGQGYPKSRQLTGESAGWGTGLKPGYEPILLARRPPDGTVAENAARHRTGAIHIDACRTEQRRWPSNLLLDHHPDCKPRRCRDGCPVGELGERARFFYCAKPNRRERDAGCEQLPRRTIQTFKLRPDEVARAERCGVLNIHPTVKPIELMRWLVRLLCPPGALVLDPFTGSGSTGIAAILERARFLGYEQDGDYARIARARIQHHATDKQPSRQQADARAGGATATTPTTRPVSRRRRTDSPPADVRARAAVHNTIHSMTGLRSTDLHGLMDRARRPAGVHEDQSGPAARQRPGPGNEGDPSMHAQAKQQSSNAASTSQPGKSPAGKQRGAKAASRPAASRGKGKPPGPTGRRTPKRSTSRPTAKPASPPEPACDPEAGPRAPRDGSAMWAAIRVLTDAGESLSAKEIYAQIHERKLTASLKGRTPEQTVAAALSVAAKQGRHVERAERGRFRLLTPAGMTSERAPTPGQPAGVAS